MKKKVVSILVALSMLISLVIFPIPTSALTSGDFTYEVVDGSAVITDYTGSETNVTVPGEINGYTVTEIGKEAFYNKSVQKVTLPDFVEIIGEGAFRSCTDLKTVIISSNLKTIDKRAFECSSLEKINLPDSVTYIGHSAFVATKLTYINLPSSLTAIYATTFAACFDLAYVRIPHTVTEISSSSFSACNNNFLTIVGCAGSAAQTFAEEKGFTFATIPCKDHTFSGGACTCCNILLGDLNKDGVVNTDDYTIIVGYVNDPSTCPDLSIADVNRDGVLDINDRLFLLEIISGVSTWPV